MSWPAFWLDWVFWIFAAGVAGFILWIWGKMLIAPFRSEKHAKPAHDVSDNDESWSLMSATSGDVSSSSDIGGDGGGWND